MGRVDSGRLRVLLAALIFASLTAGLPLGASETSRAAEIIAIRIPVLTYHAVDYSGTPYSVTPEQLDEQCRWLVENGYTAITLWQFWAAATGTGQLLPPNPVVLTNDDGWQSAMTFADILGRYGMTGNYFINNTSPLSADQIHQLSMRGPVQAHTATHVDLSSLTYEAQLAEITQNKAHLEGITGQPVHFLAWPFGATSDSAAQAASAAGIVAAFGLMGTAANTAALDPYYVPRIMIVVEDDINSFASKVMWS